MLMGYNKLQWGRMGIGRPPPCAQPQISLPAQMSPWAPLPQPTSYRKGLKSKNTTCGCKACQGLLCAILDINWQNLYHFRDRHYKGGGGGVISGRKNKKIAHRHCLKGWTWVINFTKKWLKSLRLPSWLTWETSELKNNLFTVS